MPHFHGEYGRSRFVKKKGVKNEVFLGVFEVFWVGLEVFWPVLEVFCSFLR